jgi:hypothetical protein
VDQLSFKPPEWQNYIKFLIVPLGESLQQEENTFAHDCGNTCNLPFSTKIGGSMVLLNIGIYVRAHTAL